ncbi:facilitated trehalose transporter Tret1 isoform X2 [Amyelois transitella]|uniref:facilitated trehalose transporter Tret1 isoform X2 n=1 Tax=Amyelois transitella TaxID=680683 RepID=UPI00298FE7BB|nr:facilitated trehalose transporter Tret1 isoform X2 [Amyelois transitella]
MRLKSFLVQAAACLSVAYLTSLTGYIYAWPSFTLENFKSNETVLSHPMSSMELGLLGSLTNIGALVTTPFCSWALNVLGRKYSAILFGLPFVLAWTIIYINNTVAVVLACVALSGAGAAGQAVSSVFIAEIAEDSIRGAFASTTVTGYYIGLLISYILGGLLDYHQVVFANLALSVLYILLIALLKESPVYLMQKGKEKEARKALAFYRQVDITSKEIELEINQIKLQLDPRLQKMLEEDDVSLEDMKAMELLLKNKPEVEERKDESEWKFLLKSKSSKRALATCLIIMCITIMMGSIVMQVYAEPLFKEAVPTINANKLSIFLALDFIIASALCSVCVDKFGRKPLMTITAAGAGVCTFLLGTQIKYRWAPDWSTAFIVYLYSFIYNLGAAVVPFILPAEMFLPEVRGLCNSIIMACMWITNFVSLIIFNPLVDCLGLGIVFCCFAITCFLGALYSHFYLPETKGLPADAIQLLFLKKKKVVVAA